MNDTSKALIASAAIIGIAIYAGGEPRYQIAPAGGGLEGAYVLDRQSGNVRFCAATTCYQTDVGQVATR